MKPTHDELIDGLRRRDQRLVGRALTVALRESDEGVALRESARALAGGAWRVGVTGAPGVGKSTLVAALCREIVAGGEAVAVVAADPTSPVSGGAFLGDRIRLAGLHLADEPRIFFRSLAWRGADSSADVARAADVLDAAGMPWVLIETVGAGQSDVGVRALVDTTIVVVTPDLGDDVQLLKAGILEIADIFVVARADSSGAERLRAQLEDRAQFGAEASGWMPPVVLTEAIRGMGAAELLDQMRRHREASPGQRRAHRNPDCEVRHD